MNLTTQFLYNISNLTLYRPTGLEVGVGIVLICIIICLMHYVFLYHLAGYTLWMENRAIAAKKHILGDLILMKDIQSEMEKEIEQASLRATFQG